MLPPSRAIRTRATRSSSSTSLAKPMPATSASCSPAESTTAHRSPPHQAEGVSAAVLTGEVKRAVRKELLDRARAGSWRSSSPPASPTKDSIRLPRLSRVFPRVPRPPRGRTVQRLGRPDAPALRRPTPPCSTSSTARCRSCVATTSSAGSSTPRCWACLRRSSARARGCMSALGPDESTIRATWRWLAHGARRLGGARHPPCGRHHRHRLLRRRGGLRP